MRKASEPPTLQRKKYFIKRNKIKNIWLSALQHNFGVTISVLILTVLLNNTSIAFTIILIYLETINDLVTWNSKLGKFRKLSYTLDSWIIENGYQVCLKLWSEIIIYFIIGFDSSLCLRRYSPYKMLFSTEYQQIIKGVKEIFKWLNNEDYKNLLIKYKTHVDVYEFLMKILKLNPFFNNQTNTLKFFTRALLIQQHIHKTHNLFKTTTNYIKSVSEKALIDLTPVVHLTRCRPSYCNDTLNAISERYEDRMGILNEKICCDLVPKWSRQGDRNINRRLDFRYTFSRAESCLANLRSELEISFIGFIKCMYHHYIADSMMIDSYIFKTLLD
ncbi:unnamed protein product, partial [Didymodactylos carnosus]